MWATQKENHPNVVCDCDTKIQNIVCNDNTGDHVFKYNMLHKVESLEHDISRSGIQKFLGLLKQVIT